MRFFRFIFFAVLLAVILAGGFGFYEIYLRAPGPAVAEVTIESGTGVKAIAAELKDKRLIGSRFIFETYVWLTGLETRFQVGKFSVRAGSPYVRIVGQLTSSGIYERQITTLEGWGVREIGEYLEREGIVTAEEFYRVAGRPAVDYRRDQAAFRPRDFSAEFAVLKDKPDYVSLEGYLFPDTYRIPLDATAEDIVRIMLKNFDKRVDSQLRAEIETSKRPLFEVVTMASIIEREVRTEADRYLVADILWRRLDAGMALQVDSSVNYVSGKKAPSISLADKEIDSPYNTYKYPGLPLGPIGNPGLASLLAAARPKPNDAWFFLTDSDGAVHYARTLQEHGENRVLYLR